MLNLPGMLQVPQYNQKRYKDDIGISAGYFWRFNAKSWANIYRYSTNRTSSFLDKQANTYFMFLI
jgi:hypothetical protein